MQKHFHNLILCVSVLPALLVMPVMAIDYTSDDIESYPYLVTAADSLTVTSGYSDAENGVFKNQGSLTINDGLVFDNNNTEGWGGTLHIYSANATNTEIGNNVTFSGGTALEGSGDYEGMAGAIYTWSDGTAEGANVINMGNNVTFSGNSAYDGGAIYTYGYNTITIGDNLVMENNFAANGGGAIVLNGYDSFHGKDFVNTLTVGKNAIFTGNTSLLRAGAIYIGGDANDKVTLGDGAFFSGNASSFGGAVSGFGTFEFGDVSFVSNISYNAWEHVIKDWGWTEANYNGYVGNGGAIVNRGDVLIKGKAKFFNNYAEGQAGAIYNKGTMVFQDDVTFAGNKQNVTVATIEDEDNFNGFVLGAVTGGEYNDIHNLGSLTIEGGTTTISGGITGDGTLNIGENATLNIGTASVVQGTINLAGNMFATLRQGDDAQITASSFDGTGKLNLTMTKAGTYNLFDVTAFGENWSNDYVVNTNPVYELLMNDDGSVVVSKKSVENIVSDTGVTTDTALMISHVADAAAVSESKQLQDLSVKIQEKLASGDTDAVEYATRAVHPEPESVVQSVATSAQYTVVNLAAARMASPMVGRNGGDVNFTSGGVWAQGLFNKSKQNNAFSGYTRGIAAGLDGTINKHWTIGAGYSFAHSDIDGTARNTEIDSNTLFVYGQYKPSQWYVNAVLNYTMSDYSERGTVIDNIAVTGDYDVDSFGGALATGYDFGSGVTPELGLRYMHIMANDYANSYGIKTHMDDTDFLTGVAGLKYAFNVVATRHLTFAPQLNAGVKYDLLSDKQVATVALPGIDSYTLDGNRLNRVGGEFGIGLGMNYRGIQMSLNYDIDVRKDYTSQTGMLKFRYNF